ncbi:unnamed protein product [Chrysodeixis includens]|uniref:Uncharacterized protein n=1 Tax=Chrysodeixis includens TaxID=689277 RepID=A0A9N8L5B9_CHRIL|nr:unnamed protein product [Chrysodeixis includens]
MCASLHDHIQNNAELSRQGYAQGNSPQCPRQVWYNSAQSYGVHRHNGTPITLTVTLDEKAAHACISLALVCGSVGQSVDDTAHILIHSLLCCMVGHDVR